MYCKYCGQLLEDNALFCHSCGKQVSDTAADAAVIDTEPVAFGGKFGNKPFFYATLFFTIAVSLAFLANAITGNVTVPIIEIFAIISFWRIYYHAKNINPLVCFVSPLKTLRVLVTVQRVLLWIVIGVFAVVGLLMMAIGASANGELADAFVEGFNEGAVELYGFGELFGSVADLLLANIGLFLIVFGAIFVFAAAFVLVLNLTMYKSFLKCAMSYEEAAKYGEYNIEKQDAARKWLIASLVFASISIVGQLNVSGVAQLLSVAALAFEICYLVFFIKFLKAEN